MAHGTQIFRDSLDLAAINRCNRHDLCGASRELLVAVSSSFDQMANIVFGM